MSAHNNLHPTIAAALDAGMAAKAVQDKAIRQTGNPYRVPDPYTISDLELAALHRRVQLLDEIIEDLDEERGQLQIQIQLAEFAAQQTCTEQQ